MRPTNSRGERGAAGRRAAACSVQRAACSVQRAACSVQRAGCMHGPRHAMGAQRSRTVVCAAVVCAEGRNPWWLPSGALRGSTCAAGSGGGAYAGPCARGPSEMGVVVGLGLGLGFGFRVRVRVRVRVRFGLGLGLRRPRWGRAWLGLRAVAVRG